MLDVYKDIKMTADQLSTASLSHIKTVFSGLHPVPQNVRFGFYRANFIGPAWLRTIAPSGLSLSGLAGWQGKRFLDPNQATNILKNKDHLIEKMTMRCQEGISDVDGKLGVALTYDKKAPLPWRWVSDELRQLDDTTWLCMTVFNLPLLKHFPMPFLLVKEDE